MMMNNLAQVIKICKTPEELQQSKEEFSKRGIEFITRCPNYTYEITISPDEETDDMIVTFILRLKSEAEINTTYNDY
jgi:hypothetical protein